MRHRLLNLLAALSLLLCVAVVALWVRSYWMVSSFARNSVVVATPSSFRTQWLVSERGRAGWAKRDLWTSAEAAAEAVGRSGGGPRYGFRERRPLPIPRDWRWGYGRVVETKRKATREGFQLLGFVFETYNDADPRLSERQVDVWIPYWFMAAVLVAPAASRATVLWRRRRRRSATLCASCGYDLRDTPDRCPECGTAARGAAAPEVAA